MIAGASQTTIGQHSNMPIVKETSSRLLKIQHPYEVISREVVQSITNPIALAIHTYLLTKPDGWVVRKNEILAHFDGLGSDRFIAAKKQLIELGLYAEAITRNELGQIVDKVTIISAVPEKNHLDGENPIVGKTQHTENPIVGKSPRIDIQRLPRDTENTHTHRFVAPSLDDVRAYALTMNYEMDCDRFINFYESKGWMVGKNKMKDWQAAVRNWEKGNGNAKNTVNGFKDSRRLSGAERTRLARERAYERERAQQSPNMGSLEPN